MEYKVNMGRWGNVFAVPSAVVDEYIKLASGQAIKVLLYFLRMGECDTKNISDALGFDEETVTDAITFWEQVGLFSDCGGSNPPPPKKEENTMVQAIHEEQPEPKVKHSNRRSYPPKEIAERIEGSDEIRFLFSSAEEAYGHMLNHTEQNSLLWIHDYLGMHTDIIVMLFEYCKVYGKLNPGYMEKSAATWAEHGITTHEQADAEIQKAKDNSVLTGMVKNAFGIDRKLTSSELKYISEWSTLNYSIDLIKYAYDKTIEAIGALKFPYLNKILKNWHDSGLTTIALIDDAESKRPKKYPKKNDANIIHNESYDDDPFESLALNVQKTTKK